MRKQATKSSPPLAAVAQFVGRLYDEAAPQSLRSAAIMKNPKLAKVDSRAVGRAIGLLRRRGQIVQTGPGEYRRVIAVDAAQPDPAPVPFTRENVRNAHAIAMQRENQSLMQRVEGLERAVHELLDAIFGDQK